MELCGNKEDGIHRLKELPNWFRTKVKSPMTLNHIGIDMKLRYKFFAAFLITSCVIVFLLVGIMEMFVYKHFAEYVNKQELESLNELVTDLSEAYQQTSGWDTFREDPGLFGAILDSRFPVGPMNMAPRPPRRPWDTESDEPNQRRSANSPPPPGFMPPGHFPPPLAHSEREALDIKPRLVLFDKDKQPVCGPYRPGDRFLYRNIMVDQEIIGWVGLKIPEHISNPLGLSFLSAQKKAFYIFGLAVLFIAAGISYLLSKHLISPIQELMKGTRNMAAFRFDTEINVRSNDELGMLARDFNLMAQTIKKYEEIRKQWISDISHELRTPITILKGKIEALQDGIRKMTPDTLDSLHGDVTRLGKLVEDLHYLALSDSDALRMKKTPINPLSLLKEAIQAFQIRLDQQSIQVQTDQNPKPDVTIYGNRDQLSRLFENFLENTLRYTDSPGILKISYETSPKWFTLIYEDSSPGVPDDALTMIFNRLYRVDKSRSRALGGSGLGLSICKQITKNHGGTITSDHSALGGLKITLRLPTGTD